MFQTSLSQSEALSQARQMVFHRLPSAPTGEQVRAWQLAARALGLGLAAWEFDNPETGRAGGGGYSLIEVLDPRDGRRLALLWEA